MSLQSRDTPCANHPCTGTGEGPAWGYPGGLPSLTVALSVNSRISNRHLVHGAQIFVDALLPGVGFEARFLLRLDVLAFEGLSGHHCSPSWHAFTASAKS
jgi:hypothetical protein